MNNQQDRTGVKDYGHLTNLDIMRGLAALSVALFHFRRGSYLGGPSLLSDVLSKGYLGVDVFFVISGFIIPWALYQADHKLQRTPLFLVRRFVRLYPSYFAAYILSITLWYASSITPWFKGEGPHFTVYQLITHASLTCDFAKEAWVNPAFWTLPIEAQYYLLIGLTFPLIVSKRATFRYITVMLWFLLPWLIPVGPSVFPFCALFGLGIIVFMEKKRLITWPAMIVLLCIGAVAQGVLGDWPSSVVAILTSLCIWRVPAISPKPLVWLGAISYSLYLIHVTIGGRILNLFERLPHELGIRLLGLVLAIGATIAASYVFHLCIERPSHRWARMIGAKPTSARIQNDSLEVNTN